MSAPSPSYDCGHNSISGGIWPGAIRLLETREIWSEAPHNAFTGLLSRGDELFLAFREGRGHVSSDGTLRVLRSPDGRAWDPAACLRLPGFDLRDADLSLAPDGRLFLVAGAAPRAEDGARAPTGTVAAWSEDGVHWTRPRIVIEPGRWLWKVRWHAGRAFGFGYSAGTGSARIDVMTSVDGLSWSTLTRDSHPLVASNETALAFTEPGDLGGVECDPQCVALTRAHAFDGSASVGLARAPFTNFEWKSLGFSLGGPSLIQSPNGKWIAAGRVMEGDAARTAVFLLDPTTGTSTDRILLPSGGDTSYPGLAWWGEELLVSYYSSHLTTSASETEPGLEAYETAQGHSRIFCARLGISNSTTA